MKATDNIDAYKGLLIVLVVAGHSAGALMPLASGLAGMCLNVLFESIYSFHMAAFFVLAGYLASRYGLGDTKPLNMFFLGKCRRLLVPYFIFGVASAVIWLAMFPETRETPWRPFLSLLHGGGWPNGMGFRCNSVLWFLPAMFMTVMAGRILEGLIRRNILIYVTLCIVLIPLTGITVRHFYTAYWPWALVVLPRWLSYYFAGRSIAVLSGKKDTLSSVSCGKWNILGIPVIVCVAMLVAWLHDNGWANKNSFSYIAWGAGITGTVSSAGLVRYLTRPFWRRLGKCSLGVMLMHKFVIVAVVKLFSGIELSCWSFLPVLCMVIIVSVTASWMATEVILKRCPSLLGAKA